MKIYQIKSLIQGYRVGSQFSGKILVAIPEKYKGQDIVVQYNNQKMLIKDFPKSSLTYRAQPNKFGGGTFLLAYYEWTPDGIADLRDDVSESALFNEEEKIKKEEKSFAVGKEPNVLIQCPKCGGGMMKSFYHNEFEKKPIVKIICIKCGKEL